MRLNRSTLIFPVDGILGIDVTLRDVTGFLEAADGRRVLLQINCSGGDLEVAIPIYHALRAYEGETVAFVKWAASAAVLIVSACAQRYIAQDGKMLLHPAHGVLAGNLQDLDRELRSLARIDQRVTELIAGGLNLPTERIAALVTSCELLSAERCLAEGLVQEASTAAAGLTVAAQDPTPAQRRYAVLGAATIRTKDHETASAAKASDPVYASAQAAEIDFDSMDLEELQLINRGLNETIRRKRNQLQVAFLKSKLQADAEAGSFHDPVLPTWWHCAACGAANTHPYESSFGVPTPCYACETTLPPKTGEL